MKFQIEKDAFQNALNQVQHVVANRTTLPILSNVLIKASDGGLELSTTDLDVTISKIVAANVTRSGAVTLPARRLAGIVRELSAVDVEFEVSSDNVATLQSGASIFKILGLPPDDFPKVGEFHNPREFTIEQKLLRDALRKTAYAISADETRYVLNGVHCVIRDGMLALVATDGRRLAMVEQDLEFPPGQEASVIIPTKAATELQRQLDTKGDAKVIISDNQASFDLNGAVLVTKLIEGNYPNFRQVIPAPANYRVIVEREVLLSTLRRISLFADESTNLVNFIFDNNQLTICTTSPEIGEAEETIDIRYSGPRMVMAFNPEYVMAPLRNLDQDEIYIDLIDTSSPGVIKVDEPFLYVIMPMRATR